MRRNPTVSVSPAMQQGAPGVAVTYGVSVTNNDSACGSTSFNQNATVPSGWTATFASAALGINSGATASTTLQVKASAAAAPGNLQRRAPGDERGGDDVCRRRRGDVRSADSVCAQGPDADGLTRAAAGARPMFR